jgi:virginiamycin B lyase
VRTRLATRRRPLVALACGAVAWALLALYPAVVAADVPVSVAGFTTPTTAALPDGITEGSDGAMWFTEQGADQIGRITIAGAITEYALPAGSEPGAITAGPDDALWFVQPAISDVTEITTAGVVGTPISTVADSCTEEGSGPVGIAEGSDGNLWVTDANTNPGAIVRIVAGRVSGENCLTTDGTLSAITSGPDGALWFTLTPDLIGRRATAAEATPTYPVTTASSSAPMPIVSGPGSDLWIGIEGAPGTLDSLSTADVLASFGLPSGSTANLSVLGDGPDGLLWLASGGDLTSVTAAGVFNQFTGIYPAGDTIQGIAAGPGDTLWLTDATSSTIYRVTLSPAPTVAAQLQPTASSVGDATATIAGTLSVPAGDLPQGVSYDFLYGPTTAYGSTTPSATATASPSGTPVSAALTGLRPDTTYHYVLNETGCSPASCEATSADQSFTTAQSVPPTPVLNSSMLATAVSGKVLVRLPGKHRFVRIGKNGELIPVGSTVNARHGHVRLESSLTSGAAPEQFASGVFYGGIFVVTQPGGAKTTVLRLDSSFAACRVHGELATAASATKRKHASHKVVNQVFGTAHGEYTTRGHYAAAADEGTQWRTADRCDGTYVAVSVGHVDVTDLVRHRTFVLSAGHHYLATPR